MTQIIKAAEIQPGDVILPPERELRLWMRKHIAQHNMNETALNLTVIGVSVGPRDKRGDWLTIRTKHTDEWEKDYTCKGSIFSFRTRPTTDWPRINGNDQ